MHAVRCGTFNPQSKRVSGATARTAVNHVASAIVASGRPDPTRNAAGKTDVRILRQSKAYREVDPPTRHQKALPPEVYRVILESAASPRSAARATLLAGALFFGCRSCEYSKVPRKEQKTRPLRACDFDFRSGARIIPHDDPAIFHADTVVAKFASQKSGVYEDEIPMDKTTDPALNPVALWATTITRLRSYPDYDPRWPVFTYFNAETSRFHPIRSSEIEGDIKRAVSAIGRDTLGFGPDDVGTHSNRSALAMQLYLQGVPPYTIMLIGRWRSDAFLSYIEKQCKEFTKGMSQIMLTLDSFYHLPTHRQQPSPSTASSSTPKARPNRRDAHFVHFGRLNALRSRWNK